MSFGTERLAPRAGMSRKSTGRIGRLRPRVSHTSQPASAERATHVCAADTPAAVVQWGGVARVAGLRRVPSHAGRAVRTNRSASPRRRATPAVFGNHLRRPLVEQRLRGTRRHRSTGSRYADARAADSVTLRTSCTKCRATGLTDGSPCMLAALLCVPGHAGPPFNVTPAEGAELRDNQLPRPVRPVPAGIGCRTSEVARARESRGPASTVEAGLTDPQIGSQCAGLFGAGRRVPEEGRGRDARLAGVRGKAPRRLAMVRVLPRVRRAVGRP